MPTPAPSILIVGAGAMGAFYGARLAQAGARVAVVCRSDYAVVREQGFRITSGGATSTWRPAAVYRQVAEAAAAGGAPDYVVVTTKALPTQDTAALISPAVGPRTVIALLQNGIDIEPPVAAAYPQHELLSVLAFVCLTRTAPGEIQHLAYGRLLLGTYPTGETAAGQQLTALWRAAGLEVALVPDVVTARWHKLAWNAAFNPLSVVGGEADTQRLLAAPASRALVRQVMVEVCAVAAATGHPLPATTLDDLIALTERTPPYQTSMLADYLARRPMEVDAILGHALLAATRTGVSVPTLQLLHTLLTLADQRRLSA